MIENLSIKWFIGYYAVMGSLALIFGGWLLVRYRQCYEYLQTQARSESVPPLLRTVLRYWMLFTLPCLILSFIPFSWIELLFSLWSLLMVYLAGIQLVRWEQRRKFILDRPEQLQDLIRKAGVTMVALSPVIFLLAYLLIKRTLH